MFILIFKDCSFSLHYGSDTIKFSECRRRVVQNNASQSSRTVAVQRLNWHRSAIFQRQCDFSSATWNRLLVCARGGDRSAPHVKLEGGQPC
jgi:hypothetical protein